MKPPKNPSARIAAFIARFDPRMAKLIQSSRAALRRRFPTAFELVYDNYNFLVFGFCSSARASGCIVSLAANAKGLNLMFYWGAALPDPHGLLQGSGSQNRFIRLDGPATLAKPEVRELIEAAVARAKTPLPASGSGSTIIRSISARQRPRR